MKVKSYYVPDDKESQDVIEKLQEIRWRERKSESQIIMMAIKEYVSNHEEGNDTFTLDSFVSNPELEATPALGQPTSKLDEYLAKIWDTNRKETIHGYIVNWVNSWNKMEKERCQ